MVPGSKCSPRLQPHDHSSSTMIARLLSRLRAIIGPVALSRRAGSEVTMRFLQTEPFKVFCIAAFVLITIASWFW